jgi:DNA helicase-2/ATP-dependent DNA helicase PcrA
VQRCNTDADEGREVAAQIFEQKMQEQRQNREFAILYRTNAQSRAIEDALRKRDIPYRIYGGLSFYQRKEIKDLLAYLRLLINPKDEESLKRVLNYPARGIGQTTLDKLIIGAKHNDLSLFETLEKASQLNLGLNAGTLKKIQGFVDLILSLKIENEKSNAFEIADLVTKKSGLVLELKKDGTPEGVSKVENIEELLNGIRDFVEGQKELADAKGNLSEFLEDVALATDFDTETEGDEDFVYLMTIHLSKGLEFPVVFIVGMEEDLFPSALSLNTRSELEEERRLFYVALTRAEQKAILTYTLSRYRWGKLVDAEPSRFIEEMDEKYLDYIIPKDDYVFKPMIDKGVFGGYQTPKKVNPPAGSTTKINTAPSQNQLGKLRKINASDANDTTDFSQETIGLEVGKRVEHARFGYGEVLAIEGKGNDKKALIDFKGVGQKHLLLRFAKLKVKD